MSTSPPTRGNAIAGKGSGDRSLAAFVADVGALPRAAWVIYAGTFINRFGSFLITFLILILVKRGLSFAQAGAAASAYGMGALGAAALGGYLADRIGRRRTIALSMFSSAAVLLALWQVQGLAATVALTLLAGVCAELYRPASSALLADVTPVGRRVGTFALYRTAVNAGFAVGPAVAGYLATRSMAWIFIGDAITSALYGTLVLVAIPASADIPAARTRAAAPAPGPRVSAVRLISRDRAMLWMMATALLVGFAFQQSMSTFPLEVQSRGWSLDQYGMLIGLNGLVCMVLELPMAAYTSRVAAWIPMSLGAVLVGVGMGATGLAGSVPMLALCVVVWTLGEICFWPVASAFVADLAPPGVQARYQAAFGLTNSTSLTLPPVLGTALFAAHRGALWALCALLGCAAAVVTVVVGMRRAAQTSAGDLAAAELAVE